MFRVCYVRRTFALAACVSAVWLAHAQSASAVEINGVNVVINWPVLNPTGGTMATYTYDSITDSYFLGTFGDNAGFYRISPSTPGGEQYVNSSTDATTSDLLRFMRSSNVLQGQVNSAHTGTTLIGGILLNPKPITINVPLTDAAGVPTGATTPIIYGAGELAFLTDGGTQVVASGVTQFDWTKKVYRWDLRKIHAPTSDLPDFSTGTSGNLANPNPDGPDPGTVPDFGALGQADWNDSIAVVATEAQMRNAYEAYRTANPGLGLVAMPATSQDNFSRQFAWSSDGQSLYAVDSGTVGGGIYKFNAATGATTLLYVENASTNIIAEPAVRATPGGDQIFFDGNAFNGNPGGMSYIVDNGTPATAAQVLFTGAQLASYTQLAAGGVDAVATDSMGNIYFHEGGTQSLHKYDAAGRFISVLNRAQLMEVNEANDGIRANGGVLFRLQTREEAGVTYLTYRGDNAYVGEIRIFDPGDINRDGTVNQADRDQFIEQVGKTYHGDVPSPFDANDGSPAAIAEYVDYINADVNGDGRPRVAGTTAVAGQISGPDPLPELISGGVDHHDMNILAQFVELELGDFNWNGKPLDAQDRAIFDAHFEIDPGVFGWDAYSWFDGDVSGLVDGVPDGLVDQFDLDFLIANQPAAVPEPSSLAAMALALTVSLIVATRRMKSRVKPS